MDSTKTVTYSQVGPLGINLDLHIPPGLTPGSHAALVYFHGGGFVTANREGLIFQQWLLSKHDDPTHARKASKQAKSPACPSSSIEPSKPTLAHPQIIGFTYLFVLDVLAQNKIILISADYRLLHPSTGFSIIEDVKALFEFVAAPDFSSTHLPADVTLDTSRLAVSGESSGGYPATLAGIYAQPKPRAVMLQYPAGTNILSDHYLQPKPNGAPTPDGSGATVVIPKEAVDKFLEDTSNEISDDPVGFLSGKPEQGDSGRTALLEYWLMQGTLLDNLLGRPGISKQLLDAGKTVEEREKAVTAELKAAVPQLNIGKEFPPTFLFHGAADKFFPPEESVTMHEKLQALGIRSELHLVEGGAHGLIDATKLPELAMVPGTGPVQQRAAEWLLQELN